MNGKPKENANPKVLDVVRGSSRSGHASVLWSSINRLTCGGDETDDQTWTDDTSCHDRTILKALRDVSQSTDTNAITLLLNSGLDLRSPEACATKAIFHFPVHLSAFIPNAEEDSPKELAGMQIKRDTIDENEVFDIIRNIQDPEHPLTLEQLGVVSRGQLKVNEVALCDGASTVDVRFTPTIPHCSMATLIGLSIRVKLLRSLPNNDRFKVVVRIEPGTHNSEMAVNKQLADKERVCAALENKHLLGLVNKCISSGMILKS
jgi:metal-sulfur cluster biosynthetic enzyme